ncbi:MAG: fibrobacter succinogenes major paralogous domain-containing protein [Cyclobacteriaceae bacterium]
MKRIVFCFFLLLLIPGIHFAQIGTISELEVLQRSDGSGMVDISFKLTGMPSSLYNVIMDVSFEGNENYERILPNYLDASLNRIAPSDHLIKVAWDGLASFPHIYSEKSVLRISATLDGYTAPGTMADIEGNVYATVVIGAQEWMKENLRATRYNDGTPIPGNLSNVEWSTTSEGAYAVYSYGLIEGLNSPAEVSDAYGNLYNWYAVVDERGLCPNGWRVPDNEDWIELWQYAVSNYLEINNNNIGNYLKSCLQEGSLHDRECNTSEHPRWQSSDTHYGNDYFGLSLLPGGERIANGAFFAIGNFGFWWTSTSSPNIDTNAYFATTNINFGGLSINVFENPDPNIPGYKTRGYAVRCLKNRNP